MKQKEKVHATNESFDKMEGNLWLRSWSIPTGIPYYRETFHSLSGARWTRLLNRCSPTLKTLKCNPSYMGSENQFEGFQEFVKWSQLEIGYAGVSNNRVWPLDKDLFNFGNRVYSPETCIFVPPNVNAFTTMSSAQRGIQPVGVHLATDTTNTFISRCHENGKSVNLGRYTCPKEAHRAWQVKKVAVGREMAKGFKNSHFKLYRNLNDWVSHIEDDYLNNRITEITKA